MFHTRIFAQFEVHGLLKWQMRRKKKQRKQIESFVSEHVSVCVGVIHMEIMPLNGISELTFDYSRYYRVYVEVFDSDYMNAAVLSLVRHHLNYRRILINVCSFL